MGSADDIVNTPNKNPNTCHALVKNLFTPSCCRFPTSRHYPTSCSLIMIQPKSENRI